MKFLQGQKTIFYVVLVIGVLSFMALVYTRAGQAVSHSPNQVLPAMSFELVTSTEAQERGLSGRASIPENYGMLFVFSVPGIYGFWMKDMLTPIDIIWLTDTGRIVKIDENVSPLTYPAVLYPPGAISYVLETRVGELSRRGLRVGDIVPLPSEARATIR